MAGPVLNQGAQVLCMHGGTATPTSVSAHVSVAGQPAVTLADPYSVAGCSFSPPAGNGPCATATWTQGATRVVAGGSPLVIQAGVATCVPTGTGLQPSVVQSRVIVS